MEKSIALEHLILIHYERRGLESVGERLEAMQKKLDSIRSEQDKIVSKKIPSAQIVFQKK